MFTVCSRTHPHSSALICNTPWRCGCVSTNVLLPAFPPPFHCRSYARAYGLPENQTTVLRHLAEMSELFLAAKQGLPASQAPPAYIFNSLPAVGTWAPRVPPLPSPPLSSHKQHTEKQQLQTNNKHKTTSPPHSLSLWPHMVARRVNGRLLRLR